MRIARAESEKATLLAVEPLEPGDELGGYVIEAMAGRGGMGLVYRARQRRPDRVVAIKVIAPELAADPLFRARFERESATAAEIEHPNVIPVYEVGEQRGLLFIAMRFVEGHDLRRILEQRGRLELDRVSRLVSQVGFALDAAHAKGLVHRDVKPANVLVAQEDHVYLTDFGLTKRITDEGGMTQSGTFVGTVDYVAPEQVEGRQLDARADVYSLGCVTYELLTGEVPFPRDSDVGKLFAHIHDPSPRPRGVPEPLADAVQRAMAKRPEDRFSSAGDLGRAVVAGVEGRLHAGDQTVATGAAAPRQAPTEHGMPTHRPPPPPRRRGRTAALVAGALLVVGGLATGLALGLSSGGPTPLPPTTLTPSTNSTGNNRMAVLPPATVPPIADECQQQLMFAVDGTAGPLKCSGGELNAVAWRYYAKGGGHNRVLSLGRFATPDQVFQAMCSEGRNSTNPIEQAVYQLAQLYYGWRFAVDPSAGYPNGCP